MEKPKLKGTDKNQRAYEVTAKEARQDIKNPKKVELVELEAKLELSPKGEARLKSDTGFFDGEAENSQALGNVRVTTSLGYEMDLRDLVINMKSAELNSKNPVEIRQGTTKITADTLHVSDSGAVIRLEGHVRADLNVNLV